MFDLARLFELRVELLPVVVAAFPIATMGFEQVSPSVGQDDRDISVAVQRDRPDETLLAHVAEVAFTWVLNLDANSP